VTAYRAKLAVHWYLVNDFSWPIVADQESRVSGIICVRERQLMAGLLENKKMLIS
jgi:hypothetical protein